MLACCFSSPTINPPSTRCSWHDCVLLGSPYRSEVVDEIGELTPGFLTAARLLLERSVGIWMSNESGEEINPFRAARVSRKQFAGVPVDRVAEALLVRRKVAFKH